MNKVKKVPLRKCVITGEQHQKSEMFRVVRTPEGDVVLDNTGKTRGRGAYIVKKKSACRMGLVAHKKIIAKVLTKAKNVAQKNKFAIRQRDA